MIREREYGAVSGWGALVVLLAGAAFFIWQVIVRARQIQEANQPLLMASPSSASLLCVFLLLGLFVVNPNEGQGAAAVRQIRGHRRRRRACAGPIRSTRSGRSRCASATSRARKLKVNDLDGNPIEIAAVVVWKVVDTAEAVFEVDNYENYVHVQSEAAAAQHGDQLSLRRARGTAACRCAATRRRSPITCARRSRIGSRKAGVEVIEARISHLAYAPEIAAAMLQRQQAGAIIAARQQIVEGAVGMVEMALDMLSHEERRHARRGAQGRDGQQPAGRALRRARTRSRSSTPARSTTEDSVAERKAFLLRIDPAVLDALQRWADDELRSLNGQIEFVLRRVLQAEGRLAEKRTPPV